MEDEFIFSDEEIVPDLGEHDIWTILVVDDDQDVHIATRLTLDKVVIAGRSLTLIDVNSGREAIQTLKNNKAIDLVLLDMVMESSEAGLEVANWLRHEAGCQARPNIILRTGQPGLLTKSDLLQNPDFDAVVEKSSITRSNFITLLTRILAR